MAARAAGVRTASWREWEHGRALPRVWRVPSIASAIGCDVGELFLAPGWCHLGTVVVSPASLERLEREGAPVVEELAALVSSRLIAALQRAQPLLDDTTVGVDIRCTSGRRRSRIDALLEPRRSVSGCDRPS